MDENPQPGRRAHSRQVREQLTAARTAGVERRHAAKLTHLRGRRLLVPAEDVAGALRHVGPCPTCHAPAALEIVISLPLPDWGAVHTHTDDCPAGTS
ncbi:hypothetical protein [Amycolatopsis sp.]|uniref:hypothetical protein n=1 Tax=Amycolatopsis sp. TaxID=37632 RepID=UPI002DFD2F1C|nr:hypothetical protein [Amycolatopsis sp.]